MVVPAEERGPPTLPAMQRAGRWGGGNALPLGAGALGKSLASGLHSWGEAEPGSEASASPSVKRGRGKTLSPAECCSEAQTRPVTSRFLPHNRGTFSIHHSQELGFFSPVWILFPPRTQGQGCRETTQPDAGGVMDRVSLTRVPVEGAAAERSAERAPASASGCEAGEGRRPPSTLIRCGPGEKGSLFQVGAAIPPLLVLVHSRCFQNSCE